MIRVRPFLCVLVLSLILGGCSKVSPKHSVKISDYLSLTDKNAHTLSYGMSRDALAELFSTETINIHWESAHENLEIRLTSSVEYENPTIVLLSVTSQPDHPRPSWSLPQGIRIGDNKQDVLLAFGKENTASSVLDLFFAQDPKYIGQMYEISEDQLEDFDETVTIYRIALQFKGEILDAIILGDLDSMA